MMALRSEMADPNMSCILKGEVIKMAVKVGIISDTHNVLRPEVLESLRSCDYILHAGDITRENILDQIRYFGNLYVVRGNNDRGWASHLSKKLKFEIGGIRFLMVHNKKDVGRDCQDADIVVYGHSHKYSEEIIEERLWLNPGSCGRQRFGGEVSFVLMEIEDGAYQYERIRIK